MDIIDLAEIFKKISIDSLMTKVAQDNNEIITDKNKSQIMQGKDSTGEDIQPSYRSDTYADVKQTVNSQPSFGVPDLKLTGGFQGAMVTHVRGNIYVTVSTDPKTGALVGKYGEIFGLSEKSIEEIQPIMTEKLIEEYIKATGL